MKPLYFASPNRPIAIASSASQTFAPVLGPGAESYEQQWQAEVASMPNPPELDYLNDPDDYLRVRAWHIDDPVWKEPMAGSACAQIPPSLRADPL